MMDKHAYLILLHKNPDQIKTLLSLLDHKGNDFFIAIDEKSKISISEFDDVVKNANIVFVTRAKMSWGAYSITNTELCLLERAVTSYHNYYHLLSGQCLPIKSNQKLTDFFHINNGKEFISYEELNDTDLRYTRYRLFKELIGRGYIEHKKHPIKFLSILFLQIFERVIYYLQKLLHIKRNTKISFYKGSQWFSITHQMANYIVRNKELIKKIYKHTYCSDESFLQTFAKISPYKHNIINNNYRYIDWSDREYKQKSPHVFVEKDFKRIINSNCLFARKFDESIDSKIIDIIATDINKI